MPSSIGGATKRNQEVIKHCSKGSHIHKGMALQPLLGAGKDLQESPMHRLVVWARLAPSLARPPWQMQILRPMFERQSKRREKKDKAFLSSVSYLGAFAVMMVNIGSQLEGDLESPSRGWPSGKVWRSFRVGLMRWQDPAQMWTAPFCGLPSWRNKNGGSWSGNSSHLSLLPDGDITWTLPLPWQTVPANWGLT